VSIGLRGVVRLGGWFSVPVFFFFFF